jgi:hypothetical protein
MSAVLLIDLDTQHVADSLGTQATISPLLLICTFLNR